MKTNLLLAMLFLACSATFAQNLVPNPGFEEIECPDNWSDPHVFGARRWYNPNVATPDYYGTEAFPGCQASIYSSVWESIDEWQLPHGGERMIGMYHYIEGTCIRELAACKLIEPLEAGENYVVSMYVSLSNNSYACTDCIGFAFSTDSIYNDQSTCGFDIEPQWMNASGELITDTVNWVMLEGEFVADGGEQFMIIGNVDTNDNCMFINPYDETPPFLSVYYFIDDVVVENKEVVSVEDRSRRSLIFYPNPGEGSFRLRNSPANGNWEIRDMLGRTVLSGIFPIKELELSAFGAGTYLFIPDQGAEAIRLVLH